MTGSNTEALASFRERYGWSGNEADRDAVYAAATEQVERDMWAGGCPDDTLALYQGLFREWEANRDINNDPRPAFLIVIPVADRPQQLENALESLLTLCRLYGYGGKKGGKSGGMENGRYCKVGALIADDSREAASIERHRAICEHFTAQGLATEYFGQAEQLQQLDALAPQSALNEEQREALQRIIGNVPREAFFHKGASITRNIAYLRLNEWAGEHPNTLFWFMDSDQAFQVNTGHSERLVYAINYFHQLERIFSTTDTLVLTGKVVGDPPVSPAVMAGNFLDDVSGFLSEMASRDPAQACSFHESAERPADDASYHDMADLFGFQPTTDTTRYTCRIEVEHDHVRCLQVFAAKLGRFFDGEHPTRQTRYEHQDLMASLQPARTIYTGNYVIRPEALADFIPFATLKLRMAGPVLGRLLKAEQGPRFASANLPVLHKRTLEAIGQSEFRPGIERSELRVDLSGEFERQFYGDVMLFSIEQLTERGYPEKVIDEQGLTDKMETVLENILEKTEAELRGKYDRKHQQILERLERLRSLLTDPQHWWQSHPDCETARADIQAFIDNMQHNFGEQAEGYRLIHSKEHRAQRLADIKDAILSLPQDRAIWQAVLNKSTENISSENTA